MPGRKFNAGGGYRYGFNGKELDKETTSTTSYDYGFRIYSPALGRFLSVDPLIYSYPYYTPYQFAGNMPIAAIDLDGLEQYVVIYYKKNLNNRNEKPYKIEIRAIEVNKVAKDQNITKLINKNREGEKIAKNNVLVFEIEKEGTINQQMKITDNNRSKLTDKENAIYNTYKKLDKSGTAAFVYSSDKYPEYESDDIEDGKYYVAEKSLIEKVKPSTTTFNEVPAVVQSDGQDNGNIKENIGDFSKNLKKSLSSVNSEVTVSEIKVNINVQTSYDANGAYVRKAKAKIEQQVKNSIRNITNIDADKIKVNLSVQTGSPSNSNTTVSIK